VLLSVIFICCVHKILVFVLSCFHFLFLSLFPLLLFFPPTSFCALPLPSPPLCVCLELKILEVCQLPGTRQGTFCIGVTAVACVCASSHTDAHQLLKLATPDAVLVTTGPTFKALDHVASAVELLPGHWVKL